MSITTVESNDAEEPVNRIETATAPPTRLESSTPAPGATTVEHGSGPAGAQPGRRAMPSPRTVVESQPTNAAAAQTRVNLPASLAGRYEVVRDLDTAGAEADLLICRSRATAEEVVVKLYRRKVDHSFRQILGRFRTLSTEHFVRIIETDVVDGRLYEVQEYCPSGSLADVLQAHGEGLPLDDVREVVAQVRAAIEYMHRDLRWVHRDIKPANILVRSTHPLKVVLGDLGLTVDLGEFSQVMMTASRSVAYAAPEARDGMVIPARDWWSLGVSILELLTGTHPFFVEGRWQEEARISTWVATKPIPLTGVTDPRWQQLLRGLLVRDPDVRWGAGEVGRWLAGENVPVAEWTPDKPDGHAATPLVVGDKACRTPAELADAIIADWTAAAERLLARDLDELERWISQFPDLQLPTWFFSTVRENKAAFRPDRAVATLIAVLAPGRGPIFRGMPADEDGLMNLAAAAQRGNATAFEAITALRTSRALLAFAALPDCETYAELQARWEEIWTAHRRLAQKWAKRAADAPHGTREDANRIAGEHDRAAKRGPTPESAVELSLFACVLDEHALADIETTARQAAAGVSGVAWFDELRRTTVQEGHRAAYAVVLRSAAAAAQDQLDRALAHRDEQQRQAASRARQQREAQRRPRQRWVIRWPESGLKFAFIGWFLFCCLFGAMSSKSAQPWPAWLLPCLDVLASIVVLVVTFVRRETRNER